MYRSACAAIAFAAVLMSGTRVVAFAHEIPASVTAHVLVKAEADAVRVLVRVPLQSMRDIDLPLRGPGYLDLESVRAVLHDAARTWIADYITVFRDDHRLPTAAVTAARIALPSDRSFDNWNTALASFDAVPLGGIDLPWEQAVLDVILTYPATGAAARYSVDAALAHLGVRTTVVLRFSTADGEERLIVHDGRAGAVRMDPRWYHTAAYFLKLGVEHIAFGLDHLLFLLCLIIPIRRFRALVVVVTAFTAGHSVTLIAAALGAAPDALWFGPLIEVLIAASIVWLALENIIGARVERRWIFALSFGLVHGFGFALALRESLQLAGAHVVMALAAFNVGIELGQVAVIVLVVPAIGFLFRRVPERTGGIVLSALVAHSAWHWMTERGGDLRAYDIPGAWDTAVAVALIRGAMVLLIAVLCVRGAGALAAWRARTAAADYSSRSADIGSTRAARQAGSAEAARPTSPRTAADSAKVIASVGDRP